jgi:hypothetical protein
MPSTVPGGEHLAELFGPHRVNGRRSLPDPEEGVALLVESAGVLGPTKR